MDKFGTVEGDLAKVEAERLEKEKEEGGRDAVVDLQSPTLDVATVAAAVPGGAGLGDEGVSGEEVPLQREKKKLKMWLGIW